MALTRPEWPSSPSTRIEKVSSYELESNVYRLDALRSEVDMSYYDASVKESGGPSEDEILKGDYLTDAYGDVVGYSLQQERKQRYESENASFDDKSDKELDAEAVYSRETEGSLYKLSEEDIYEEESKGSLDDADNKNDSDIYYKESGGLDVDLDGYELDKEDLE